MKDSFPQKTPQPAASVAQRASAGPHGLAIAPPACGIGSIAQLQTPDLPRPAFSTAYHPPRQLRAMPAIQSGAPIQRKPWSEDPKFPDEQIQALPDQQIPLANNTPFVGEVYESKNEFHREEKPDVTLTLAAQIPVIAADLAPEKFHAASTLRKLEITQKYPSPYTGIGDAGIRNSYKNKLDPTLVKMRGTYGNDEPINLFYMFAQESYGYIVRVEQEGQEHSMDTRRGADQLVGDQEHELTRDTSIYSEVGLQARNALLHKYASAHEDTGAGNIRTLAGQESENLPETAAGIEARRQRIDAITKLGGEGSRWQCVANAANFLNDDTLFVVPPTITADGYAVAFKNLWLHWKDWYGYKFNISDDTTAKQIVAKRANAHVQVIRHNLANPFITTNAYNLATHAQVGPMEANAFSNGTLLGTTTGAITGAINDTLDAGIVANIAGFL